MGREDEGSGPLGVGDTQGSFFAYVYRTSGRLVATADYKHSATPPIHQEAIEQSQMRRNLNTKSGVFP